MGPVGSVLAIDYGLRKTGFAVADGARILVEPLDPVRLAGTGPDLLEHVAALLAERDVATLLVGLPLGADGGEGGAAAGVRGFIRRLQERFPGLEICAYDERLTTKEADARLREAGYRGKDARSRRDSWSAMVLLEDWIASGEPRSD